MALLSLLSELRKQLGKMPAIVLQDTASTPWRGFELRCCPKSQKDGAALQSEAHHHEKMNVKDAAAELGVSIHMIYKLMRNGQLAYLQVGRRRLPISNSVTEYRQKNTVEAHRPMFKPARTQKVYRHMIL